MDTQGVHVEPHTDIAPPYSHLRIISRGLNSSKSCRMARRSPTVPFEHPHLCISVSVRLLLCSTSRSSVWSHITLEAGLFRKTTTTTKNHFHDIRFSVMALDFPFSFSQSKHELLINIIIIIIISKKSGS